MILNDIHVYMIFNLYLLINDGFIYLMFSEHVGHSHLIYAGMERSPEGSYTLKPLKQKQFVDGLSYLLQEIYGIENKNMERQKVLVDSKFETLF